MKLSLLKCLLPAALVGSAVADTFSNPLKPHTGSDPFLVYVDGYYYLTVTTWTDLQITRAKTLEGLKDGETKVVWKDDNPMRCCSVWAPEIHEIDGTWYFYYTAGSADTLDNQRSFVLKGGSNPWDDYDYAGQLTPLWGIDGTVLKISNKNYFVWSCMDPGIQSLCIATLDTPTTIGETHILSQPLEAWEREGAPVQEGAAPLYHNDDIILGYSASYCWTANYSLATLTYDKVGDPLLEASWTKSDGPLFVSANGNYGTGHNAFFTSPDGSEIWNIFHATSISTGACDTNRYAAAVKVGWNADGTPDFGEAPPLGEVLEGPSGE